MDENLNNLINTQYPQSPVDFNTPFVPPAQPTTPPKPKVIATSKPARKEFMKQSMNLSKMLSSLGGGTTKPEEPTLDNTKNDPYMQMLNQRSVLDDEITRSLISSINANKYQRENEVRQQYDRYTRGLELLGVQSGSARYTPELFAGKIQEAEMQKLSKLREFDVEANKALLEAKQAQASGQLNILREKMNRIQELKSERDNYLKNLASNLEAETSIADNRAEAIYESLQTLNPDEKEVFLEQVADTYGIPLPSLISAVSRVKTGKTSKAKSGSSGSTGGYTKLELRKLRQAGVDPTDIEASDNFLYGDENTDTETSVIDLALYSGDQLMSLWSNLKDVLGIKRKVNLSRKNEIAELKSQLPNYIAYLKNEVGMTDTQVRNKLEDLMGE